jgi:hypothetical protein
MNNIYRDSKTTRRLRLSALALASTLALVACGGGGGSPGTVNAGSGGGSGTGTGTGTGTTTPVTGAKLTMTVTDGSGAAVTSLSGGQSATVKATVLTADGKPAVGAIVQFASATAGLVEFTPGTGSALTDSTGMAVVAVKPASVTAAGAVSITATSVVGGVTTTAAAGIAVGAAPLTVGNLSFASSIPSSLAAFNTLALNIPVTSGGQPVSTAPGLVLSSLCIGDGLASLVIGTMANGIQSATYTNNGCLRGTDVITASIGSSSKTISVPVSAANIGTIQFTNSSQSDTSIVLKGSGGLGRSESAQLTFKVVDDHSNGLAGVDVNFTANTYTGGLTVSPSRATTDASGNVTTVVSSGTIPTPVVVSAEATRNGVKVSGSSSSLTISTGLPIQRSMSISTDKANIEGHNYDGELSHITILMADQYGNPVSDNTSVNFITEGGAVGNSNAGGCLTVKGGCSVDLRSQEFRPTNGRVTVLAYAQGIEDFTDENGDGQYSCTNYTDPSGATTTATYRPLIDTCVSGGEKFVDQGDPFLDTDMDGVFNTAVNDRPVPYNHPSFVAAGNGKWGANYIRRSIEIVFSDSVAKMVRQVCTPENVCRDWTANDGDPTNVAGVAAPTCATQRLAVRVYDLNNNPMPYGTTVAPADVTNVAPQAFAPGTVVSTNAIGGTIHFVNVKPDAQCRAGDFSVLVTTPKGTATSFKFTAQ